MRGCSYSVFFSIQGVSSSFSSAVTACWNVYRLGPYRLFFFGVGVCFAEPDLTALGLTSVAEPKKGLTPDWEALPSGVSGWQCKVDGTSLGGESSLTVGYVAVIGLAGALLA